MFKFREKASKGMWVALFALVIALFAPAALVLATGDDEELFSGSEFCQDFFGTSQF